MLKNRDYRLRFALAVEAALVKDQATDPEAEPFTLDDYLKGGEGDGAKILRLARYELDQADLTVPAGAQERPGRDRGS